MKSDKNRQRVLIVDDVTKNIQLVANFLKQAGYDINFAISGKTAIRHIKKERFDLILLDIMMPKMDGFEVCHKLKSDDETKDIPVIFLTAKADIDSITKAFKVGGIDYITKPFNKAELLARVKTHLELQQQKRNLKELNATKDKFFSIIAHDLKSPLNQLLGLSEILQKEIESDQGHEVIKLAKLINESAKSGSLLLANLLEWSRSQTGSINFNPEILDMEKMTNEAIELNENNAIQKNISIKSKIKSEVYAFADGNMIRTILRNLISNGIKFTLNGGKIILNAKRGNDMITYSVSDNGIGIKINDIKKLFRIDINPKSVGNSVEKGTGLGLILCKEFIEINGGKIWVESKLGEGSTFKFSMPASKL
ncbi:MAG: hybrid sensor histidine kinase/response regulator [Cyclobacteriaceae bacterium]|nr:hybrid sensor histidine kinase/response regulator [Cyclobacteriaceae bacterium]